MRRRYVTVDVFTDQPFGGNPLAVVLDAEGLSTAQMQALAAEFNYSETTFVLPPRDPAHAAQVRIFTPNAEIPFAGHPNVGTAFVLAGDGRAAGDMVFEETAGLVAMRLLHEGGGVIGAELTAPQRLARGADFVPAEVAAALGLAVEDIAGAASARRGLGRAGVRDRRAGLAAGPGPAAARPGRLPRHAAERRRRRGVRLRDRG